MKPKIKSNRTIRVQSLDDGRVYIKMTWYDPSRSYPQRAATIGVVRES